MASSFLGAIVERFDNTVKQNLGLATGLFLGQAPEGTGLPCVVIQHSTADTREWTFEDAYIDNGNVTFYVYAEGATDAETIADEIIRVFATNWNLIIAQNISVTQFLLRTKQLINESQRSAEGELVFRSELVYDTMLSGTIPTR